MTIALLSLLAAAAPWVEVERVDGIVLEAREVKDSPHRELRATTQVKLPAGALCDAAYGPPVFDAAEPSLKSRKVLSQGADEVVHYDQMATPVLTDRDVVVRERRERRPDGSCRVFVDAVTDPSEPPRADHVRIEGLRSSWTFEPKPDGTTAVTHVVWTDPKVSLPVAFVEPSRRESLVTWVKLVLRRAERRDAGAPSPSR